MISVRMGRMLCVGALALAGCSPQMDSAAAPARRPTAPPRESTGTAAPIDPTGLPAGHPTVPIANPQENNLRVGRAPRRLSVDQLRASLLAATGYTWVAPRSVPDPTAPGGTRQMPNADMLEALAATLGRPDYLNTTAVANDPAVTFSKLASDAARVACRRSVADDLDQPDASRRRLLREVGPATPASDVPAARRNLAYLARRFWGRALSADSAEITGLLTVFTRAATTAEERSGTTVTRPAGTPADGWRAVCIALATDTQFLTY